MVNKADYLFDTWIVGKNVIFKILVSLYGKTATFWKMAKANGGGRSYRPPPLNPPLIRTWSFSLSLYNPLTMSDALISLAVDWPAYSV